METFRPALVVFFVLSTVLSIGPALGSPGYVHDTLGEAILHTPPESGGAGGLTPGDVASQNRWMDNPATKTGQYTNQKVGKPLSPSNHGSHRHNPDSAAKALSGDGSVNPARKNVARVHKILDVANNKAPVDGWKITPKMRQEAQQLVKYIERNGKLPPELPPWVDEQGRIITSRNKRLVQRLINPDFNPIKLAVRVGTDVTVLRMTLEGGIHTVLYAKGDLSKGQLHDALAEDGIKAVASGALTMGVLVCFVNPGLAVIFVVATGACIVVDLTYDVIDDALSDDEAKAAFCDSLPDEFREGLLVEVARGKRCPIRRSIPATSASNRAPGFTSRVSLTDKRAGRTVSRVSHAELEARIQNYNNSRS